MFCWEYASAIEFPLVLRSPIVDERIHGDGSLPIGWASCIRRGAAEEYAGDAGQTSYQALSASGVHAPLRWTRITPSLAPGYPCRAA